MLATANYGGQFSPKVCLLLRFSIPQIMSSSPDFPFYPIEPSPPASVEFRHCITIQTSLAIVLASGLGSVAFMALSRDPSLPSGVQSDPMRVAISIVHLVEVLLSARKIVLKWILAILIQLLLTTITRSLVRLSNNNTTGFLQHCTQAFPH